MGEAGEPREGEPSESCAMAVRRMAEYIAEGRETGSSGGDDRAAQPRDFDMATERTIKRVVRLRTSAAP